MTGVKAPGKLRKPIKEKALQKRYLKHIEQPDDRKWFASQFELKDGKYYIREGLEKNDVKRLKFLLGVVKKNRKGSIKFVPLVFAGIVVGSVIVFFAIFADPLLERAMEIGLEAIFEARADVTRLRIRPFDFSIEISKITVANRDKPMTNLFEMGKTGQDAKYGIRIKLKPAAVLRGKIYIEEISANELRFGTPRTVSGALPERPAKVKQEKQKSESPPLIDLQNFDAMALLNSEFDKLSTPKLYDDAINAYNETAAKWKGQVDDTKRKIEELKTSSQPIVNFKIPNIDVKNPVAVKDAIAEINAMITNVNNMVSTAQSAADDATKMVNGIQSDINMVRAMEQNARNAITNDIDHLKSYIDISGGGAFAALEPVIRDILTDSGELYFDYGLRALEILEQLKAENEAKPKKEKPPKKEPKVVFKGRDVIYPTRAYPAFYLGVMKSDFTITMGNNESWNWRFDLENISSDPDLTNKPVTLELGVKEETGSLRREVTFNGNADFRSAGVENRFGAKVAANGFPVSLDKTGGLAQAGINGFKSDANFSVNLTGHTDGGVSGGGGILLSNALLVDPEGTIAQALDTAIREASNINLGIQYSHRLDQKDEFNITSNIAELMAEALKRIAQEYAKKAMDEIERALRARIAQYIDGKFASKEELDALFALARGDKAAADTLKNSLNSKKTELENKVKEYTDQATQQVKDEAAKQGQQALEDIKQGQTPTIQAPSLPSGGLKLPGR